ncbi:MAG TPA: calcium-binding protein, partial [Candidatus Omnitrophota bacterium]|nr:calcium-binding protein [Candidatus Omnitrophota bacterium]
ATVVGGSGSDTITTGQGDELVFGDAMTEGAGVLVPLVIDAGLADTDGSESLAIALSGLPDGATLVDGSGAAVGTLSGGAWMLTPDQLGGLAIALPDGAPTSFTLTVSAGATEAVGGDAAWTSVPVSVALGTIGEGDDVIATGLGKDTVHGGGGDDVIHGEGGADRLFGGSGDDVILGGDQGDVIVGGAGDDVLVGGDHADTFLFELGSGHDMVDGGDRNWTDTIDLTGLTPGTGFTITTESGESWTVAADEAQHELDLGDNVAGTIVTDAGDRIDFENIEEVRW